MEREAQSMLAVHAREHSRSTWRVRRIIAKLEIGMDTNVRFAMVPPALRTQTHSIPLWERVEKI